MAEDLKVRSKGRISFCISDRKTGTEIEISTERDFPVNPQIKGAIKSLQGVVMVEEA